MSSLESLEKIDEGGAVSGDGGSGHGGLSGDERASLELALSHALAWHGDQVRKQSGVPYTNHLLQVSGLVLEHGGDAAQAVAGLLHDSLEDARDPADRADREQRIEGDFGPDILQMVVDCTDTGSDESLHDKKPWRERKTRFLEGLPGVSDRSLLVVACDKRHNLHAIVWDLRLEGLGYLDAFNAGLEDQLWYFDHLVRAFRTRVPERLYRELAALREELRAVANWA